jgi:hypothetical protein
LHTGKALTEEEKQQSGTAASRSLESNIEIRIFDTGSLSWWPLTLNGISVSPKLLTEGRLSPRYGEQNMHLIFS